MNYRVDAIFRDKANKELLRRTPIWTGVVDDPKQAVVESHPAITAICHTDSRIDSIAITVKGEDGSQIATTEYAEDFTIGYGASALDNSGLVADGLDTNLTDEQRERAMEHLKARAVQALPGSVQEQLRQRALEQADPVKDFFGGKLPSESTGEGVSVPVDDPFRAGDSGRGGQGGSAAGDPGRTGAQQGRHTVSAGPGCDKTINDCKHKFDNQERFGGTFDARGHLGPCPWTLHDRACGVPTAGGSNAGGGGSASVGSGASSGSQSANQGAVAGRQSGGVRNRVVDSRDADKGRGLLDLISDAAKRSTQHTGRTPIGVNVNATDAKNIARALGLPAGATVNGGTYKGLRITVDENMGSIGPQLVMGDSTGIYTPGGFAHGGVIERPGKLFVAPLDSDGKPGTYQYIGDVENFKLELESQDPALRRARDVMNKYLRS